MPSQSGGPSTRPTSSRRPGTSAGTSTRPPSRPTTGMTTASGTVNTQRTGPPCIVAVMEGRGIASEVGMAAMDLATSLCTITQVADTPTFTNSMHHLVYMDPVEIVVSMTSTQPGSLFVQALSDMVPTARIVPVNRKYFQDATGLDYIQQYGLADSMAALGVGITSKYFCLCAVAALFKYIEGTQTIYFMNHSIRFKYASLEGTMLVDPVSARNLELTVNLNQLKSRHSLFGVMNHTRTGMGSRLLKTTILQPSTDLPTIQGRHDAIEELLREEERFFSIKSGLTDMSDINHLISQIIQIPKKATIRYIEQGINTVLALKASLEKIEPIQEALVGSSSPLLQAIRQALVDPELSTIQNHILNMINPDVTFQKSAMGLRHQRCYAVKSGFNGLLDVARQTYKETTNDLYDLVQEYSDKHGLPFQVTYTTSNGFHMRIGAESLSGRALPLDCIQVVRKKSMITCTTLQLMSYNDRIKESLDEVYLMSDKVIGELLERIRDHISPLYAVGEALGLLDMLLSFSHLAMTADYVKPEFSDTLVIQAGRHPIREVLMTDPFVPNDTYASLATSSLQFITGPNMSGKSTYLKQIGLIVVMAYTGSFVPATYASIPRLDSLLTRLGADDSLLAGASSYMSEMRETAFLLHRATSSSLILIDELGRGTATHDGMGITLAVCEQLVSLRAITFFVTHLHEVVDVLCEGIPTAVRLHLQVDVGDESYTEGMTFMYRVQEGLSREPHYGLKVARMAGWPGGLVDRATHIAQRLEQAWDEARERNSTRQTLRRARQQVGMAQKLWQVWNESRLAEEDFRAFIKSVQRDMANVLVG